MVVVLSDDCCNVFRNIPAVVSLLQKLLDVLCGFFGPLPHNIYVAVAVVLLLRWLGQNLECLFVFGKGGLVLEMKTPPLMAGRCGWGVIVQSLVQPLVPLPLPNPVGVFLAICYPRIVFPEIVKVAVFAEGSL